MVAGARISMHDFIFHGIFILLINRGQGCVMLFKFILLHIGLAYIDYTSPLRFFLGKKYSFNYFYTDWYFKDFTVSVRHLEQLFV